MDASRARRKIIPLMMPFLAAVVLLCPGSSAWPSSYPWLVSAAPSDTIEARIPTPEGFARLPAAPGSFAAWLRGLPLKKGRPQVRLHSGLQKIRQWVHHSVVDIDVGRRDLQQCADAVMRLRAEYLFSMARHGDISFNFTGGQRVPYARWRSGERPSVRGNAVRWQRSAPDPTYAGFRRYMDLVFTYAGSFSLQKELKTVSRVKDVEPGDVFIQGGFPGHAVIVVDVAAHRLSGEKVFLIAQSFMPAQDVHVLKNLEDRNLSPWYRAAEAHDGLRTPEWDFPSDSLRRF